MQDRYSGDVGDFGKIGLIRALSGLGQAGVPQKPGLFWQLYPDESHNADGKHVAYLEDSGKNRKAFRACDPQLWDQLKSLVDRGDRRVKYLEQLPIWPQGTRFFSQTLDVSSPTREQRLALRRQWFQSAFDALSESDYVFFDPDNGLEINQPKEAKTAGKFLYYDEAARFFQRGQSLVIYQHVSRNGTTVEQARDRLAKLEQHTGSPDGLALKYRRGTARLFLIIPQGKHTSRISECIGEMLQSPWKRHFEKIG